MPNLRPFFQILAHGSGRTDGRGPVIREILPQLAQAVLVGWKRSPGVVLLALTTGVFLFRSTAVAEDAERALNPDLSSRCSGTATTLCLNDGRFSVAVSWRVPDQGRSGQGTSVPLSGDTGLFWFFHDSNIELVVKVLDGTGVNGSYWVFYAGLSDVEYTITVIDLETGRLKTYDNQSGSLASVADTSAFTNAPGTATAPAEADEKTLETRSSRELYALFEGLSQTTRVDPKTAAPCAPGGATLCLAGSRFQVTVDWDVPSQGGIGHGTAVLISNDTGYFWFFDDANVELAVKVLDGRPINGHFWIFAAALSNVKYTLTVTDTQTGLTMAWDNPDGQLASWADTGDFSDTPPPPPEGLSGNWHGTISFLHDRNLPFGFDTCEGSASITVALVETGGSLTGQFETPCGTFMLHGLIRSGAIFGSLDSLNGPGRITGGVVSPNQIQLLATVNVNYDGDGDADDVMGIRIALSR